MIAEGRVTLDGVALTTPATLLPSLRGVSVDGEPVRAAAPARLFAYHKPAGVLTTARDPGGRATIYDRLPRSLPRVVPVGRLDLNTSGLLLLTTDGELKRALELPATGVERTYRARAYGQITQAQLEDLIEGIEIDGVRYGRIDANLERRTGANVWIELTLTEGKNREVRRVLEHLGLKVSRLIRTRYGPFILADMPEGAVGEVRQVDVVEFRRRLGKPGQSDGRILARPLADAPDRPAPAPAATTRAGTGPKTRSARPTSAGEIAKPKSRAGAKARTAEARKPSGARQGRSGETAAEAPKPRADKKTRSHTTLPDALRGGNAPRSGRQRPAGSQRSPTTDQQANGQSAAARPARPPRRDGPAPRTAAKPGSGQPGAAANEGERTKRPPRPVRKPGWARAKPKAGPGGKPRGRK